MSDDSRKEYNQLMMELYKENQGFLNKAIFGISTLAIPFLFEALKTNDVGFIPELILGGSLIGFFGVIALQIVSLKKARDGCDKSLEHNETAVEDGERLFNQARFYDIWRERIFILSLLLIVIALFTSIIQKEVAMAGNDNGKELQNSFTPPKATSQGQRSFVPPQASVSQNKPAPAPAAQPASGGTSQGQPSSSSSNQTEGNQ
jgi:hypothetical protein